MDTNFQTPKISVKAQLSHPRWENQIQMGKVKIGDFRPVSRLYLKNGATQGRRYYGTLVGTRVRSIEWRYFQ